MAIRQRMGETLMEFIIRLDVKTLEKTYLIVATMVSINNEEFNNALGLEEPETMQELKTRLNDIYILRKSCKRLSIGQGKKLNF
jgi:hypothetical protein